MQTECETLLETWGERLFELQVQGTGEPQLDGGILCPACGVIHGRCYEAIQPFLTLYRRTGDPRYLRAVQELYHWVKASLFREDGSILNDATSGWKGTTVFGVIMLAESLMFHEDLLPEDTQQEWRADLRRSAEFLYQSSILDTNNINYPLTNALAMLYCGRLWEDERYLKKAEQSAARFYTALTENGLLSGEGDPLHGHSDRGCAPIDIGYNVEETLPALLLYALEAGDEKLSGAVAQSLKSHLAFLLPDGGLDNSFGSRNYKWSYWGSRTTDGLMLACLLLAKQDPLWAAAARCHLKALRACTHRGLLYGGPHYWIQHEQPCVHHSFAHAKVLAAVLDRGLEACLQNAPDRWQPDLGTRYYNELATWRIVKAGLIATITAYDWEFFPAGHVSGGTLSLLYMEGWGPVLASSMNRYSLKEAHNMQMPRRMNHECLSLRIEAQRNGVLYSSVYENLAEINGDDDRVEVSGSLKDEAHTEVAKASYAFHYQFGNDEVRLRAEAAEGRLIIPLISGDRDRVVRQGTTLTLIHDEGARLILSADSELILPYGTERVFNLVPGFQALKVEIELASPVQISLSVAQEA